MSASTNQITPNCYDKKALLGLSLIETFDFLTFQMVIIRFVFLFGLGNNSWNCSHAP